MHSYSYNHSESAPLSRPERSARPRHLLPRLLATWALVAANAFAPAAQAEQWQRHESENFLIWHLDASLAQQVAARAERQRRALLRYWGSASSARQRWQPLCTIYLYPSNEELVRMTGGDPKAGSALARQSALMQGKVFARRINLAADDGQLLTATLPHEISHIVIKEFVRDIPRWADEGLAMFAESVDSMRRRQRSLRHVVVHGPFYRARTLMRMTRYPEGAYVHLYYAQCFALMRMLIDRGGPKTLLAFLAETRGGGSSGALLRHYGIRGPEELERRYLRYCRQLAGLEDATGSK